MLSAGRHCLARGPAVPYFDLSVPAVRGRVPPFVRSSFWCTAG